MFCCIQIALLGKPKWDLATNHLPEKPGGEGWLVGPEQQLFCQFKPDSATVHAQWVAVRTYRWVPPCPTSALITQSLLAVRPALVVELFQKQVISHDGGSN